MTFSGKLSSADRSSTLGRREDLGVAFFVGCCRSCFWVRGPSSSPAAVAAMPSPSPTEDLTLYKTSELLTSLEFYNQQVKAALIYGDNASAQQWARRRSFLLDETAEARRQLSRRNNPTAKASQPLPFPSCAAPDPNAHAFRVARRKSVRRGVQYARSLILLEKGP